VKRTFLQLSQVCIVVAIALILYYDFLMVWPHLGALFWASAWSLVLARPQQGTGPPGEAAPLSAIQPCWPCGNDSTSDSARSSITLWLA
jgi:hypothetical protein